MPTLDKMAPNDLNGTRAFTNGSSHGPAPPSPPLQTVDLQEQIDNFNRAVKIILQYPKIFENVTAVLSDKKRLEAALDANHDLIHQGKMKSNGLQSELESKETTIQDLQDHVQELQSDVASKDQALKKSTLEAARLKAKLAEETAKVKSLVADKEALMNGTKGLEIKVTQQAAELAAVNDMARQLQTQHDAKVRELRSQLDTLNGYALPTHDLQLDEVSGKLRSISQLAVGIVSNCFANDLPAWVFERDNDDWQTFQKKLSGACIPLPPSNSPDAKLMRTAAVLRFLADVAREELFQPFYTLKHGNELSDVLHKRIDDDDHADFVRRVLLRTEPASLDKTHVTARVKAVKRALKGAVGGILSKEAHDVFFAALGRWCDETAQVWRADIQPLSDSVHAHIDLYDDNLVADEWFVLPATPDWVSQRAGAGQGAGSSANGTANTPLASINDVAAYVWPLFWTNGELAQHGLVVTKALVAPAQREVDQLTVQQDSGQRASRALFRSRSSANGSAPATPATPSASRPF